MTDLVQRMILAIYRAKWETIVARSLIVFCAGCVWGMLTLLVSLVRANGQDLPASGILSSGLLVALAAGAAYTLYRLWKRAVKWAEWRERVPHLVAEKLEGGLSFDADLYAKMNRQVGSHQP